MLKILFPEVKKIMTKFGLADKRGGFHDARAGFACERYRDLTGKNAPAVSGERRVADREADREARATIAVELGHGASRLDVLGAYIGGRGR